MNSYTHKIGKTFALGGAFDYVDAEGNALDPAGIVGIAIAPVVAALALAALLGYGALCAIDFVLPQKAEE